MNALVIFYLHKLYVEIKDKIKPCEAYPTLQRNLDDFSAKMITFQGLFRIEGTKGFLKLTDVSLRVLSRFVDPVGHETKYASKAITQFPLKVR